MHGGVNRKIGVHGLIFEPVCVRIRDLVCSWPYNNYSHRMLECNHRAHLGQSSSHFIDKETGIVKLGDVPEVTVSHGRARTQVYSL